MLLPLLLLAAVASAQVADIALTLPPNVDLDEDTPTLLAKANVVLAASPAGMPLTATLRVTAGTLLLNGAPTAAGATLTLTGSAGAVVALFANVTYAPDANANAARYATPLYFPSTPGSPTLFVSAFNSTLTRTATAPLRILDLNDAVAIVPPRVPSGPLTPLAPFFGDVFVFEASTALVTLLGLDFNSVDQFEGCGAACSRQLDVTVRARQGAVNINSRTNLGIYSSTRTAISFVGEEADVKSALRGITYQLQSEIAPLPSLATFNTQRVGGGVEMISVTISDQGYSGWDKRNGSLGLAQIATFSADVTIVAVNNPPTLGAAFASFTMKERVSDAVSYVALTGLTVTDVDADEVIKSSWCSLPPLLKSDPPPPPQG
jgi:hypothetical protein